MRKRSGKKGKKMSFSSENLLTSSSSSSTTISSEGTSEVTEVVDSSSESTEIATLNPPVEVDDESVLENPYLSRLSRRVLVRPGEDALIVDELTELSLRDESFRVSSRPVVRAGSTTCVLCPLHSVPLSEKDAVAMKKLSLALLEATDKRRTPCEHFQANIDPLDYVGKLSAPSNLDAHRSSDIFGRPEMAWGSGLLSSPDDDPMPSTSSSSSPTLRSPSKRLWSPVKTGKSSSPEISSSSEDKQSFFKRIMNRCCCGAGMKLRCFERARGANSYYLLENLRGDKDSSTEKQEELSFYSDNGSQTSVVVEKNLRAIDLAQILAVKNRLRKDYCWSIVEHWVDLGIERVLEDHEDVLSIHRQTEKGDKKFILRNFPNKYDFFAVPETYFPPDMIDLKNYGAGRLYPERIHQHLDLEEFPSEFEGILMLAEELPVIFSQAYLRDNTHPTHWEKTFLLLKDSVILMSSKVRVVAKFLRAWREATAYRKLDGSIEDDGLDKYVKGEEEKNEDQLEVLADLDDYEVYTCLNAKNQLKGPTEFGVVLRKKHEEDFSDPIALSFDKGKDRVCWVTAMRLAKYGKQLRENYKAFKNKQENLSAGSSPPNINESAKSRVAMDFTGKVGRIVEDPLEAKAIAISEGNAWKKRLRAKAEAARSRAAGGFVSDPGEDAEKSHYSQPWFHKNMSREQASTLISNHAKQDGVFLVRGSQTQSGANVLSLKSQEKVVHLYIMVVEDPLEKIMCYTIDNGTTKFFDICQLVEFYRLNSGPLPCRLSSHIEKAATPGSSHSDTQ